MRAGWFLPYRTNPTDPTTNEEACNGPAAGRPAKPRISNRFRRAFDPGAVIRPILGEWHPRMPERLDDEELADWRAGHRARRPQPVGTSRNGRSGNSSSTKPNPAIIASATPSFFAIYAIRAVR
jgi:hypothetical protein